jgi:hypothetical protein
LVGKQVLANALKQLDRVHQLQVGKAQQLFPLSHLRSPVLSVTLRGGKRDQACDGSVNSTGKRKGSTLRRSPTTLTISGLEGRGSCGSTEGLL